MVDLTRFEALTGGAFDCLNWQHSGEFDQNFSKKSNARGFARGGVGSFEIDRYIIPQGEEWIKDAIVTLPVLYTPTPFDNSKGMSGMSYKM